MPISEVRHPYNYKKHVKCVKKKYKLWEISMKSRCLTLRRGGLTYSAIGKELGVSTTTAWNIVKKGDFGVTPITATHGDFDALVNQFVARIQGKQPCPERGSTVAWRPPKAK